MTGKSVSVKGQVEQAVCDVSCASGSEVVGAMHAAGAVLMDNHELFASSEEVAQQLQEVSRERDALRELLLGWYHNSQPIELSDPKHIWDPEWLKRNTAIALDVSTPTTPTE